MTTTARSAGTRRTVWAVLLVAAMLVLSGCGASEPVESSAPSASAAIPATPVGERTQWILDLLNEADDTSAEQWTEVLHPSFTAEVSADELVELLNRQVRPARPLVATSYRGDELSAVTTITGEVGEPFDLSLTIDEEGLITGLLLGPVAEERTPAATLDEIGERFADLPGTTRVLATLDDESLVEIHSGDPAPLGSIFKLFVLAAVAGAVADGTLSWEDTVTVTDDVRSLPSGELQDAANGTEVTVRDAAQKMIAISDNTATDLLIHAVGRDAVEAAVSELGHHDPDALTPFPTTREVFALLWGGHGELEDRWNNGDVAERRAVLDELAELPFDVSVEDASAAGDVRGWQRGIEWFASAEDVALAHAKLAAEAQRDPSISEILGENPGVAFDSAVWPEVAFKGGSSPGVLTGSWRAVRADGAVLTIVVLSSSDDAAETAQAAPELFGLVEDLVVLTS